MTVEFASRASGSVEIALRECRPDLLRYLRSLLGENQAAEDAVQELALRMLRAAQVESIHNPRAWLFHAAANIARDRWRRRRSAHELCDALEREDRAVAATPDEILSSEEELCALSDAVARLPPQQRRVLLMARVEGLSNREISARLGLAPKTIENHITLALRRLLEERRRRGGHG